MASAKTIIGLGLMGVAAYYFTRPARAASLTTSDNEKDTTGKKPGKSYEKSCGPDGVPRLWASRGIPCPVPDDYRPPQSLVFDMVPMSDLPAKHKAALIGCNVTGIGLLADLLAPNKNPCKNNRYRVSLPIALDKLKKQCGKCACGQGDKGCAYNV